MGFSFQTGHPTDKYGEELGERIAILLRDTLGVDVPLGTPGQEYCLNDEMAWSWWSRLQAYAVRRLGAGNARQLAAVDAWNGVYVDAEIERVVLWPQGRPAVDSARSDGFMSVSDSWFGRLLRRLGLRRRSLMSPGVEAVVQQMVSDYGARQGERGALQVASLRGLLREVEALLKGVGVEPTERAVDTLRRSYSESDDRVDRDPELQCLCHAWLTGTRALADRSPLWLIK